MIDRPETNDLLLVANSQAERSETLSKAERAGYDPAEAAQARADLKAWKDYCPTPLVDLQDLARAIGVRSIHAKDEGQRTELGSFKALGGAYALAHELLSHIATVTGAKEVTVADLEQGTFSEVTGALVASCASDGNHGRSVAWGAKRFGCQCVIYLPNAVSQARAEAIEAYGAEVVRVDGNYDDAVRQAAVDAEKFGRLVISDTATPDYTAIPRRVMAGYTLLLEEAYEQLGAAQAPTHVFVQVGCGALAAAVAGYVWDRFGTARPTIIAVEPRAAACLLETTIAGSPAIVEGDHPTIMGGLACGEVSHVAWHVLRRGMDFALAMPDDYALDAMRLLASGNAGQQVVGGESGSAGIGALLALRDAPELCRKIGLDADSRVLTIITEGATDLAYYRQVVAEPIRHAL